MVTALKLCEGAAEEIGVKTAEVALEPDDFQVLLDRLNDMLLEWKDDGLTPAFNEVFNGDDTVEIDSNARAAVKYNLAIRSAAAFQKPVTIILNKMAEDTMQRLEASTAYIGPVAYPDTLPLGSGNECGDYYDDVRFFPENKKRNF